MAWVLLWLACAGPPTAEGTSPPILATVSDPVGEAAEALAAQGVTTLRWGYTPYLGTDGEGEGWSPLLTALGERLGVPITLVPMDDYAGAERAIVAGDVDVASMSPYGYVQARRLAPGLRVFASHVARGTPTYGVYLITRHDSGIDVLEDLAGASFGFVDRRSTSGWLFPAARMLEEGLDPRRDVKPVFLGSHGAVFDAVATGQVAAGAVYDHALTTQRQLHPDGHRVRVLAKAPRVPFDAYVLQAGLPAVVGDALAGLLSEISTRSLEGRRLLRGTPSVNGFFAVDDDHYDILRLVEQVVEEGLNPG